MPVIEPSSVEDIPDLMTLVQGAYRGESSKVGWTTEADLLDGSRITAERMKVYIESKNGVLLKYTDDAEFPDEERILGCVHLEKITKKDESTGCYLGLLTVSPTFQSRGIGKQLLEFANEWARSQGCSALFMTVISCRSELIKWYEKEGFQDTGEREPFFVEPEFGIPKKHLEFAVYEKRLDRSSTGKDD